MKRQLKEKSVSKNTTPSESARFSNSNHKKIYSWLILALCILLYANTIQNGYVLDDKAAITQNTLVKKGISSIPELFKTSYWYGLTGYNDDAAYRPVSLIMFAAEWQLFPDNPHISHLVNILIYGLICVLLFELLIGLFPSWPMILKLIAVLLFAAHPVHTEVVANIKSRDELMALLFSIYAFLLALKFSKEGRLVNLILIPVALILAMFSKESAFTMVALLPLTLYAMVPGTSVRKGLIILTTVITCIL